MLNKFFATAICVFVVSVITGFIAEMKEFDQEKRTGKRDFTLKQNATFPFIIYAVIAILAWLLYFSYILYIK